MFHSTWLEEDFEKARLYLLITLELTYAIGAQTSACSQIWLRKIHVIGRRMPDLLLEYTAAHHLNYFGGKIKIDQFAFQNTQRSTMVPKSLPNTEQSTWKVNKETWQCPEGCLCKKSRGNSQKRLKAKMLSKLRSIKGWNNTLCVNFVRISQCNFHLMNIMTFIHYNNWSLSDEQNGDLQPKCSRWCPNGTVQGVSRGLTTLFLKISTKFPS